MPDRRLIVVVLVSLVVVVVLLLALAQLILPGLAAGRLRSRLDRDGTVISVHVTAYPAIKLLWHRADSVHVHLRQASATVPETGDLLADTDETGSLVVSIDRLEEGPVVLRDVTLTKHGAQLDAQAVLADSDLRAALPPGLSVAPVASGKGELVLRAQGSLFGLTLGVDALLRVQDGALVIAPVGIPFGSLVTLTLFSDPRVIVEGVGARPRAGGYTLTAQARVRG